MEPSGQYDISPDGREIQIPRAVRLVAHVAFFFEDAEHRADGRVALRIGHLLAHLGGCRLSVAVKNVHDLTFATTQLDDGLGGHQGSC